MMQIWYSIGAASPEKRRLISLVPHAGAGGVAVHCAHLLVLSRMIMKYDYSPNFIFVFYPKYLFHLSSLQTGLNFRIFFILVAYLIALCSYEKCNRYWHYKHPLFICSVFFFSTRPPRQCSSRLASGESRVSMCIVLRFLSVGCLCLWF